MAYRVFISHSSRDRDWVESIRGVASAAGVDTYLYEHDLQPGRVLADKLEEAIRDSDALLVLLTRHGIASQTVQQEVGYARGRGKLIIPLVEEGVSPAALGLLAGVEYIPFDPANPESALVTLSAVLRKKTVAIQAAARDQEAMQTAALIAVTALVALLLLSSTK